MSNRDIVRAWKDEEFRNSLSEAQRAKLPQNPVGAVELPDDELGDAAGASPTSYICASFALTILASCGLGQCEQSVLYGTCGPLTYGCCY